MACRTRKKGENNEGREMEREKEREGGKKGDRERESKGGISSRLFARSLL